MAIMYTTFAVARRKPENIQACMRLHGLVVIIELHFVISCNERYFAGI